VPTAMFAGDECCEMGISFAELEQAEAARLSGALVPVQFVVCSVLCKQCLCSADGE
jgi:hypothetical protein